MTLGELIDALGSLPAAMPVLLDHSSVGEYSAGEGNRGRVEPGRLRSYRGIYAHLALERAGEYFKCEDVAGLLAIAERAVDATFEGYKGGDFKMSRDTPVWVADGGEYTGWALMAIDEVDANDEFPAAAALLRVMDIGEYQ
jgi:hypothetical protein